MHCNDNHVLLDCILQCDLCILWYCRFSVCGKLVLDSGRYDGVSVTLSDTKSSTQQIKQSVDKDGGFCTQVKPGVYRIQVITNILHCIVTR